MTVQHIVLVGGYPDGQWCCGLCGAGLTNGTITHKDDCRWVEEIREAERERILVPDETVHADGSIGPDTAPEWGGDAAYWYRRWLFLAKMLDEEASDRLSAYAGMQERLDTVVAVTARSVQRESDARLAEDHGAFYFAEARPCRCKPGCALPASPKMPFADLLRSQS